MRFPVVRLCLRVGLLLCLLVGGVAQSRADIALFLEEPHGEFGAFNPTGHAAVYLSNVCAETPTKLRDCFPGEHGVVISRYHHVPGVPIRLLFRLYRISTRYHGSTTFHPSRTKKKLRSSEMNTDEATLKNSFRMGLMEVRREETGFSC